ncbi:hypothetical protein FACS1894187_17690 [Synergistales bacterium]|nr:hypothetical protein FACS1894187_17690 [Synergistales bacterium]
MSAATVRSEDVMTDFQFRALMRMVSNILKTNSLEDAQKMIDDLAEGKTSDKRKTDDE